MTMGVFAAGSPSANFQSGTKATDKDGNPVTVTFAAATQTPSAADITAVIPNGTLVTCLLYTSCLFMARKTGRNWKIISMRCRRL